MLGLYAVQRPSIGGLGLIGAVGYAYSYVAFTATVVYSFVEHTPDWVALTQRLGAWFLVHGAIMVVAGLCFGLAVVRAGVLPRWTGYTLMAGVCLVAATTSAPDLVRVAAATVRAAAFVGMGLAVLSADFRVGSVGPVFVHDRSWRRRLRLLRSRGTA